MDLQSDLLRIADPSHEKLTNERLICTKNQKKEKDCSQEGRRKLTCALLVPVIPVECLISSTLKQITRCKHILFCVQSRLQKRRHLVLMVAGQNFPGYLHCLGNAAEVLVVQEHSIPWPILHLGQ